MDYPWYQSRVFKDLEVFTMGKFFKREKLKELIEFNR
jgi:hypothetical protein